jgi:DeoR/GlpR family transcriptional regulator of sugar metabolism
MSNEQRRAKIVECIERDGFATVVGLAKEFAVSPVTVHRDLGALAQRGAIRRIRGGGSSFNLRPHEIRTEYVLREAQNRDLKLELGMFAVKLIPDRSVIFLDGSTTCVSLFKAINTAPPRQLTIVTNSLTVASSSYDRSIGIVLTPGDVDQSLRATIGSWTPEFLQGINIDIAFISGAALSLRSGLMTTQAAIADVGLAAINRAGRSVAVVDSSKFDSQALLPFADAGQIDLLLSDSSLPDDRATEYQNAGWTLERSTRLEGGEIERAGPGSNHWNSRHEGP